MIVLQQLAVAFGLGLLLGLQRERAESSIGGIRTFPLIAVFGTVCDSTVTGPGLQPFAQLSAADPSQPLAPRQNFACSCRFYVRLDKKLTLA